MPGHEVDRHKDASEPLRDVSVPKESRCQPGRMRVLIPRLLAPTLRGRQLGRCRGVRRGPQIVRPSSPGRFQLPQGSPAGREPAVDRADDGRPLGLRDVLAILGHLVRALMALALIGAVVAWVPGPARARAPVQVSGGLTTPLAPGTMTVDRDKVAASGGGISLTFTYTAANDGYGLKAGTVMLTVPDGWTAPSSEPGAPGFVQTTALRGSSYCVPTVDNMTIAVSGVALARDQSFDITYTDVAAPDSVATFDFTAQVTPASRRPAVDLCRIQVTCANGVGELTVNPQSITAATTGTLSSHTQQANAGLLRAAPRRSMCRLPGRLPR